MARTVIGEERRVDEITWGRGPRRSGKTTFSVLSGSPWSGLSQLGWSKPQSRKGFLSSPRMGGSLDSWERFVHHTQWLPQGFRTWSSLEPQLGKVAKCSRQGRARCWLVFNSISLETVEKPGAGGQGGTVGLAAAGTKVAGVGWEGEVRF